MNTQNKCPACEKGTMHEIFKATPLDYSLSHYFSILKCNYCGHGVTAEPDTNLDKLYNTGQYETKENIIHKLVRPVLNIFERNKVKFLDKQAPGKRLLEVGCGKGYFLLSAKNAGFSVTGIEPSDRSRSYAKSVLSQNIYDRGLLEYVSEHNDRFDTVYLWHVLEHLDDLPASINAIRKILNKNGVLVFGVPNFSSVQAAYGGQYWYHLDPPRHINHFTPTSINEILSKHGFADIKIYYNSYFQDFIGEFVTIANRIFSIKNLPINLLKRNPGTIAEITTFGGFLCFSIFILTSPLLLLTSTFCLLLSHIMKRPGSIVVVAR